MADEPRKPVEDIDRARNHLMLSSVGVVLYYGGQVAFAPSLDLQVAGLRIDNPSILPVVLVLLWLYFWQRFTSLSSAAYGVELGAILTKHVNATEFVRRVIDPRRYAITDVPKIETRNWMNDLERTALGPSHVIYIRKHFCRVLEFSYLSATDTGYVHFLGPADPVFGTVIQSGRVGPLSLGYWRCLAMEARHLASLVQREPLIVYHYAPRALAVAAGLVVLDHLARYFAA